MASKEQVQYHYDVDNDFYQCFLDHPFRLYSCGVWKTANDLETAQIHKMDRLLNYAHVTKGTKLIDVGCGWGGLMRYATEKREASLARGLTLSRDQHAYIAAMKLPLVKASLQSWSDYSNSDNERFDAVVSIGAFEHFASLDDRSAGRHRDIYRSFFQWCKKVSTPDAYVGLQTIVTARTPSNLEEVKDTRYLLDKVFPGSALPSISDVQAAVTDQYEISACKRIGPDYSRTLQSWRERLLENRNMIEMKHGIELFQHYETYFSCAIRNFNAGVVDLLQISLKPTASLKRVLKA